MYTDAVDIIELFKVNPQNPIHFPDEPNPLKIMRTSSYRKSKQKNDV